jgi:hypothetical protein
MHLRYFALLCAALIPASAADIAFTTDPFAGSTALTTAGRQVVGNELFLSSFDFTNDRFVFDFGVFGISGLSFFNGPASTIPSSGRNVIVLQTTDDDANTATPFNAGSAANLIAAAITVDGPGFFIYFNQGLGLNRLVYSTNLNDNTADLKVLARILSPTGTAGIAALGSFAADDFAAVPEPATFALAGAALLLGAMARRR